MGTETAAQPNVPTIELRLTENLRTHLLQDSLSPLRDDGLLDDDHPEHRASLGAWADAMLEPRRSGDRVFVTLTPMAATEMIRQIIGVKGIWQTRTSGVNPRWSDSFELSRAAKARGAIRAGERVVRETSDWLEDEVGAEIEWSMGTPTIHLPSEVM